MKQSELGTYVRIKNTVVHDPPVVEKPLPLPPGSCSFSGGSQRAYRTPAARILRRGPHDPFLAAYVACTRSECKNPTRPVQVKQKQKKRGGFHFQGCGVWSGCTATKYAEVVSCKRACAVYSGLEARRPVLDLSRPPAVPGRERLLKSERRL